MTHYQSTIDIFYRPELTALDAEGNYSKSPTKPRRFVEHLLATPLARHVQLREDFAPLAPADFLAVHTEAYVRGFFRGEAPHASSNGLAWTPAFAATVRYTNASLLAALAAACDAPSRIALSPTSGFHHATPSGGGGFCTFSGQALASLRLYRERGLRGAWIDLDGHFGNSLGDTMEHVPELAQAVPFNLNPRGRHGAYLADLAAGLEAIGAAVRAGEVDYVAFAHGADSHEDDDLGGQCTTDEWLAASHAVYGAVAEWSAARGRPIPLALALFGGYRKDDYDFVLRLHAADVAVALEVLAGVGR